MGNILSPGTKEKSSIEETKPLNHKTSQVSTEVSNYLQDYNTQEPDEQTLRELLGQIVKSRNPSPLKVQLVLDALEEKQSERALKDMRDCIEEHSRSTGINLSNLEESLAQLSGAIYRKSR